MNIKNPFLLSILFSFIFCSSFAQIQITENTIGKNVVIPSKILDEERKIQIFLPEGYDGSSKKYPVVYILDGQRLFLHGVSLSQSFKKFKLTPEYITVGITNTYPKRFGHFSSGAKTFLNFIAQELIPYVDHTLRTSGERLLFGWEYAGGFVIETMTKNPELFSGYLAASPYPIHDTSLPISANRMKSLDSILSAKKKLETFLFFTSCNNEGVVTEGTEYLKNKLESEAPNTLRWEYTYLQNEEHRSTPYHTLYYGLKQYYHNYPELRFDSLEEYKKLGGMDNVITYYKKRAEQFGFPEKIAQHTMWNLVKKASDENNHTAFNTFINQFKPNGFIENLRTNWGCVFAEFYLKHNQPEKAKELYTFFMNKSPNAARPVNGLGDVYRALKNKKEATMYYQRAIRLGKKNADWRLQEYEKDLLNLKNKK
ncbi:alpha/beta hydrolase-fold protein [Aquimarina megaterium]|uniref:alpha/beta hydrolase-fold protein n=1 Tax=Aquimarina megaterium TaxID=1443666 RepID=UPI00046FBC21|nr:alpha/beta hydrolase-fold protein [Aquimarina megaterium]